MKVWTVYWAQTLRTRHYMTKSALLFLLSVFILVYIGGCGEKLPEGLPKLVPVKITVIQDGNPLEGAVVSIVPVGDAGKWSFGGTSGADGSFNVLTHGKYPGMPQGKYKATVTKTIEIRPQLNESDPPPLYALVVDKKFGSKDKTPFVFDVPSTEGEIKLDVGKAVKIELK
ncbi:MAG: carboxypeptidase-like regulatory domain-containing protein [Planctomycetia bacterium]|nr:carboxypeptidase-like regulatory domain-containing protein [Planctomycetia bacterium]